MAVPFPAAEFEALIYMSFGALLALLAAAGYYIRKLHSVIESTDGSEDGEDLRVDNIGLSKKSEDVLNEVMEDSCLQSELPGRLEVSKATVSNAVSELFERNLVRKRKKANTYLIEANMDEIRDQQR